MASNMISTNEMEGMRVLGGKNGTKRVGKVRRVVFHPTEKRVVGFIVKRPDFLWMFRRKDWFVAIDGFDLEDGRMIVHNTPEATDKAACQALGVNYDQCVLWEGLPVMTADGQSFGVVGNVEFNRLTGAVRSFSTHTGAANNALLGHRVIPAEYIQGFRRGIGTALNTPDTDDDQAQFGAMLVSDEVKTLTNEGGVAEKAGQATAVAMDKVQGQVDKVKEAGSEVAKKTGEAVNKGAYATGRQLKKSQTMFSDFKKEYDKAVSPDQPSKTAKSPSSKPTTTKSTTAKSATSKSSASKAPAKKKNMFSAFKEEYDKARHE